VMGVERGTRLTSKNPKKHAYLPKKASVASAVSTILRLFN